MTCSSCIEGPLPWAACVKIPILLKLNTEDKYKHTHNITKKRLPSLSDRTKFHITAYFRKYPKKLNCDELINYRVSSKTVATFVF